MEILTAGNHIATAADITGVAQSTLFGWLQLGREARAARDRGERLDPRAREYLEFLEAVTRARARATADAIGVVQKVMVGGYLISEEPALSGDGLPIYDQTGALAYKRVFAQPDGRLAMEYASRHTPDLWGRNGVARVELSGPDGGPIAIEESTMAAALTKRFEEVLAREEEERRELEALGIDPDADDVYEGEVVE